MEELAGAGGGRPRSAGLGRLVAAEHVPARDPHLSGDGGLARVGFAVAALDVGVELVPGVVGAPSLLGALDRGPAQRSVSGMALDHAPDAGALTGLLNPGVQAGVAEELAGAGEAPDVA